MNIYKFISNPNLICVGLMLLIVSCGDQNHNQERKGGGDIQSKSDLNMKKLIDIYDIDKDKNLSIDEYLAIPGPDSLNKNQKDNLLMNSFKSMDLNCDGKIDYNEMRDATINRKIPRCVNGGLEGRIRNLSAATQK